MNAYADYSLTFWFALWISILAFAISFVFAHGIAYVSWPRLNPLTDVIEYNGPGFRGKRKGRGLSFATVKGRHVSGTGARQRRSAAQEVEMGAYEKKRVD